jgi:hypothetical protein
MYLYIPAVAVTVGDTSLDGDGSAIAIARTTSA